MPVPPPLPSYLEVAALESLVEGVVAPEFIDVNGHMNIRHHLDYCASGAEALCREAGIDDGYRAGRSLGVFTAEHHIRYTGELHQGDRVSVHTRFLDRGTKAGHLISFLLDRERRTVACVLEISIVHVDMRTRRPTPFPDDVARVFDARIAESRALPWSAPVSGAMGIRTPRA
ncbi:thioesterase family protein [soil metagenome]